VAGGAEAGVEGFAFGAAEAVALKQAVDLH
jgi:hypothetical protein